MSYFTSTKEVFKYSINGISLRSQWLGTRLSVPGFLETLGIDKWTKGERVAASSELTVAVGQLSYIYETSGADLHYLAGTIGKADTDAYARAFGGPNNVPPRLDRDTTGMLLNNIEFLKQVHRSFKELLRKLDTKQVTGLVDFDCEEFAEMATVEDFVASLKFKEFRRQLEVPIYDWFFNNSSWGFVNNILDCMSKHATAEHDRVVGYDKFKELQSGRNKKAAASTGNYFSQVTTNTTLEWGRIIEGTAPRPRENLVNEIPMGPQPGRPLRRGQIVLNEAAAPRPEIGPAVEGIALNEFIEENVLVPVEDIDFGDLA